MDADTVVELLKHYDLVPGATREDVRQSGLTFRFVIRLTLFFSHLQNLNRFMRFCNIGYQVVPMDPALAIVG